MHDIGAIHILITTMSLPVQPDAEQISRLVASVVLKARENDSLRCVTKPATIGDPDCKCILSSLTPRLVRSEVENKLGIPGGTLDAPAYKSIVKSAIHDAMVCASFIICQAATHDHNHNAP
jgi:hypothetical protein